MELLDEIFDFRGIRPYRPPLTTIPYSKIADLKKIRKFTICAKKCGKNRYIWFIKVEMSFKQTFEILAIFCNFGRRDLLGNH